MKVTRVLGCLAATAAFVATASPALGAYPGKNGKIVFEHKKEQLARNSDPWTVSAGKPSSAKRLVKIKEDSLEFAYSPNGKKIAFDAYVPSQEIVVMRANGTRPKVITEKIDKCIGKTHPTWSPNGKRIAFVCLNDKGFSDHDVWSTKADGTGIKQISKTHDAFFPRWSPQGDKIAYTSYGGAIYTVPAGGGASTMISEEAPGGVFGGQWEGLDWSPDGKTLVADASGDGIYTVNPTTGATSTDLANNGIEPVFSPDGKKILYVGIAESGGGTKLDLWMMDANGTNKSRVTQSGYNRAPNWGPAP
jgi:Tol biopolymer transport system component